MGNPMDGEGWGRVCDRGRTITEYDSMDGIDTTTWKWEIELRRVQQPRVA